jgi:preprotein translocase subunit SecE
MNSKVGAMGNAAKWAIAILLTLAGVVANNYYQQEVPWPLRLAGWIILGMVLIAITLQTSQGKRFLVFTKDAKMELRKVEWPKRQETMQFTLGVVVMVIIMSLALWLIDIALLWVVKWFTG